MNDKEPTEGRTEDQNDHHASERPIVSQGLALERRVVAQPDRLARTEFGLWNIPNVDRFFRPIAVTHVNRVETMLPAKPEKRTSIPEDLAASAKAIKALHLFGLTWLSSFRRTVN